MISSWFERLTMTVILINCVTLGMYKPCADTNHCNRKCLFLTVEQERKNSDPEEFFFRQPTA